MSEHPSSRRSSRRARAALTSAGVALLAGLVAAVAIGALLPVDLPPRTDPTFVEVIFDNRWVVLVARLLVVLGSVVLVAGGAFVVMSIAIRIRSGHWLRRAGPFEVSEEAIGGVGRQIEALKDMVSAQRARTGELEVLLSAWANGVEDPTEGHS